MMEYYLKMFVVSLLFTEIMELLVLCLLKENSKKNVMLMVLVNLLTNPAAVFAVLLLRNTVSGFGELAIQIPIELLVIGAEALIYVSFSKERNWNIKRPVILAILANTVSWLMGAVLQ